MTACDSASPEPLTAAEDATVPMTVAEDATVPVTVAEDATVRETAAEDAIGRETVAEDATEPVTAAEDAIGRETAAEDAIVPVTAAHDTMVVRAELQDRSFRQFEPHVDGDPRRGVIVSFFDPLSLWAQYAEGRYALNEWEITSREYRIEKHGDTSEVTLYFVDPRSSQGLPTKCDNCIDTAGVSISIRNYEDRGSADIKINDPDNVLPSPFPVFDSWTEFREDEIVDGG